MSGGLPDTALAPVVAVALLAAIVATFVLVALTLIVHARMAYLERRRARWTERWTPRVLDLLDGAIPPAAFAAAVRPRQRDEALRFLAAFAVRLKDDDRRRLSEAATPFLPLARRRLLARSPEVRAVGVHLVGLLSERPPLTTLGSALRDPSRRVGLVAARALAETGTPEAAAVMLAALSRFGGAHTASVASLLARFGLRAGPLITAALVHPRTDARACVAAAEALLRLSYVPAAPEARALLARPGLDRETTAALLRLLGAIGGSADASVVRTYCASPDDVLRVNAVTALGHVQCGPDDLWVLRQATRDPNRWIALRANEALGVPAPRPQPPAPARPREVMQ